MAMHDSSREEVIDEPELNVDDYLYCKISSTSNYDDYLYKRAYTKLSPQKVLEELDDPELYSQLSNSVISFLKRSQKTSCENSSVSSGSDSDTSGHNVSNTSSPSTRERAKGSSSPRPVKKDSLLYLQLLKEDRERSNSSSSNINKREYERAIDFQQTLKRIPSPQYVVKKAADVNNITVPCTAEEFSSSIRQERKLLPSTVNNNYNISPQSIEEMPLKYTTKIVQPVKSVKNNVATATVDNVNNNNGFQQKHEDIVNIIVQNNNNNKQISNNNILLKTYKNVTLNFSKQYQNHSNTLNNKSDATNCHNEFNNNNIVNNNNNNYSNDNSNADVINSKKNSNDVLLMNQPPHSKILYRHLTNENNKFYNHSGKKCFIPLSNCRSNENLKDDNSHLELSAPPPPPTLPLSPATLQLYAATTGNVSNVICEKSNNFMIPKGTMLKTLVTTTTSPAKNILTREPLQQQQQQQQQQRALNIVSGDRNGNNYDSIITLSLENSNNNNNNQNNIDINRTNNSPNNNNNITGNFFDNNSNSSNSEIVIEVGDKSKLAVNNNGCCGNKEIVTSAVPLQQSLHYQQHQLVAPTMVCLKRGGDIGQPSPSSPQHYNQQSPLFNRSHVTHIVERKLIPSNSSTNKYETTFIQKRSEQLVPIQTCRILDNKQVIKQYCGPKVKSEKRTFSVMEPIVISPSVPSDNGSPALSGSTIKGTDDMFKGVSNEQMSSLQRLLKLGTTATVMSNEEKKIKLETIVKKLWAKELCEPPLPPQSSSEN